MKSNRSTANVTAQMAYNRRKSAGQYTYSRPVYKPALPIVAKTLMWIVGLVGVIELALYFAG